MEEDGADGGEDEVEEKAGIGLEAEDAGSDAEEGGREALEVGEGLRREWVLACYPGDRGNQGLSH